MRQRLTGLIVMAVMLLTCVDAIAGGSDFLVNNDSAVGWRQEDPAVARNASGATVIAWIDYERTTPALCMQWFDPAGVSLGALKVVHSDSWIGNPAVAASGGGNCVVTWCESGAICTQRFDSCANPIGSLLRVSGGTNYDYGAPAIAIDNSGRFMVVWKGWDIDAYIYAQLYDSNWVPLGKELKVSTFLDDWGHTGGYPSVDIDESGRFVIAYMGKGTVYAQSYSASAVPLGWCAVSADANYPAVAADGSGGFVISWSSADGIFAQRFDSQAIPMTSSTKVSDQSTAGASDIAMLGDSNYAVTWAGQGDIYMQRMALSGVRVGGNVRVDDDSTMSSQSDPHLAVDSIGNILIVWLDDRYPTSCPDIFAQRYDPSGLPLGVNYRAYVDSRYSDQLNPAMTVDGSGNMFVAWHGSTLDAAQYSVNGILTDRRGIINSFDYLVGDDSGYVHTTRSSFAGRGCADCPPCFEGYRFEVRAQTYDSLGNQLNSSFLVDASAFEASYAISCNTAGDLALMSTIRDCQGSMWFAARFDRSLNKVSEFSLPDIGRDVSLSVNHNGDIVFVWANGLDIYARRYGAGGVQVGDIIRVSDSSDSTVAANRYSPIVAADESGNLAVAWVDSRNDSADVYLQSVDYLGNLLGPNIRVNHDVGSAIQDGHHISAISDSRFVIAWNDNRNDNPDVYAQVYEFPFTPVGGNQQIADPEYVLSSQMNPTVALKGSKIYFAWQDDRRDGSWDIYGRIMDWPLTDVNEEPGSSLPLKCTLSQNYPNPFNPTTAIEYAVSTRAYVTVEVFNALGQHVRTLVDEMEGAGTHRTEWNGTDAGGKTVSTGVYLYRLVAGNYVETKKMLLVK